MSTVDPAAPAALTTATRSKKTTSMNNIVDASSKNGADNDELLDIHTDFVSLRKKSADDLLSIATSEPFVLSQGLSFTSGSILQSSSPPLAGRRSPSPVPSSQQLLSHSTSIHPAAQPQQQQPLSAAALISGEVQVSPLSESSPHNVTLASEALTDTAAVQSGANSTSGAGSEFVSIHRPSTASVASSASVTSTASSTQNTNSAALAVTSTPTTTTTNAVNTTTSTTTTVSPVTNPKTKVSERAKKKAWYSVLYPSYKSRSEDFKKLFKGVPDDERLVVDYSCAVQRDILVHGRLYVSQNYLCFYANIFRWETCLSIRWKDVTAITKEKTALVIPNAILVSTVGEKYFITSFTSRDKAYLMLFRVWQNALMDKPMQPQEMWQWVHNCYGDELGLTSDDEDYIDPYENRTDPDEPGKTPKSAVDSVSEDLSEPQSDTALQRHSSASSKNYNGRSKAAAAAVAASFRHSSPSPKPSRRSASPSVVLPVIGAGAAAVAVASSTCGNVGKPAHRKPITKPTARKQRSSLGEPICISSTSNTDSTTVGLLSTVSSKGSTCSLNASASIGSASAAASACEQLPTDMSDSSDSEAGATIPPFVCTAECSSMHEGRQLVHTILPINVDQLFTLLFSKSKFLVDFHAHRKTTNMVHEDWQTDADGAPCRKVNLTVALTQAVGPKCSHVTEHQVQRACSEPAQLYSIDITSTNAGIPYADSFYVFMHYCLVRTVDDHTMFSVHAQVKYKKSVWGVVKGFIEKNTWAGLEDFYTALLRALQSEYCIPPAKAKGRRPRTRGGATGATRLAAAAGTTHGHTVDGGVVCASGIDGMQLAKGTFALCTGVAATAVAGAKVSGPGGVMLSAAGFSVGAAAPMSAAALAQSLAGQITPEGSATVAARGGRWSCTTLSMLLVVGALVLVNVILYLNLWRIQGESVMGGKRGDGSTSSLFEAEFFDFRLLKNSPKSSQEWLELLKKQEALHATETNKWQSILQTAVQLLHKTEQTLSDLLVLLDMKEFPTQQYSATAVDESSAAIHGEL